MPRLLLGPVLRGGGHGCDSDVGNIRGGDGAVSGDIGHLEFPTRSALLSVSSLEWMRVRCLLDGATLP